MVKASHDSTGRGLIVDILCDGAVVGRGSIRAMDAARAFIEIADFALGADTFLELLFRCADGRTLSVPVRLLENTGRGLEVGLEGVQPESLLPLLRGHPDSV